MPNHINFVEAIRNDIAKDMPNGMDSSFLNKVPFLIKRIDELEAALVPFARAYNMNKQYNKPAAMVNTSDLKHADDMMDPKQSLKAPKRFSR
jgi:hypothetical protein